MKEYYSEIIHGIYGDKDEVAIEARIKHRDGRVGAIKTTLSIKSVEGASL